MIHFSHMRSQKSEDPTINDRACTHLHADYMDYKDTKKRLMREFTGGIVRGLGMAIGGTIVFGLVAFLLGKFLLIPGAQNFLNEIKNESAQLRQSFGDETQK